MGGKPSCIGLLTNVAGAIAGVPSHGVSPGWLEPSSRLPARVRFHGCAPLGRRCAFPAGIGRSCLRNKTMPSKRALTMLRNINVPTSNERSDSPKPPCCPVAGVPLSLVPLIVEASPTGVMMGV